ncbi:hypothetical protein PR001_g20815 [Phytophthora rubi]|uniref:DDE Tnp4 domain-containing protein n=1 Tax=Phytophthora rubi TaxID=129364 RepID=A0A6A3JHB6_9STRA|nr:hypothetical protein PR001_g20815 [Phytophthora rubi]
MQRVSERQRLLRDIVDVMAVATLEEEDDDLLHSAQGRAAVTEDQLLFSELDQVSDMLQLVESSRYLVDRERIDSCTQFNAEIFMASYPTSRFRQRTRMDKSSFERVVNKIKDNPVFYNDSPCSQAPVWMQLAVALDRFGNYGSGASLSRSQELWGIGKGTVDDYTDRVVKTLLGSERQLCGGWKHRPRQSAAVSAACAVTVSEKAAVNSKPSLIIDGACHPHPAVNAAGETSGGLKGTGEIDGDCKGSGLGSQVYGRAAWHKDLWAIIAVVWLDNPAFEKPKVLAVSTTIGNGEYHIEKDGPPACGRWSCAPPFADYINGTSPMLVFGVRENTATLLGLTTERFGEFQDLVMWEQLTEAARGALSEADFGEKVKVPFIDANFKTNLEASRPFR